MNKPARSFYARLMLALAMLVLPPSVWAAITVSDDAGNVLTLRAPARRIISLAPHATELLYAAGAGDFVVGAVEYSDYPEPARRLPRVGSGSGLDLEKIVSLNPDLIVAWSSGNPFWQIKKLRELGMPVFETEPRRLDDVAKLVEKLGWLAATESVASGKASQFRNQLDALRHRFATRRPVSVFYQILDNSLLTISQEHLISDVIQLCGGANVFAELPGLTRRVDMEAVLRKNPEVVLASGHEPLWTEWRGRWHAWPALLASSQGNIFFIPPDLIHRNSLRILLGAEQICLVLDQARETATGAANY